MFHCCIGKPYSWTNCSLKIEEKTKCQLRLVLKVFNHEHRLADWRVFIINQERASEKFTHLFDRHFSLTPRYSHPPVNKINIAMTNTELSI